MFPRMPPMPDPNAKRETVEATEEEIIALLKADGLSDEKAAFQLRVQSGLGSQILINGKYYKNTGPDKFIKLARMIAVGLFSRDAGDEPEAEKIRDAVAARWEELKGTCSSWEAVVRARTEILSKLLREQFG